MSGADDRCSHHRWSRTCSQSPRLNALAEAWRTNLDGRDCSKGIFTINTKLDNKIKTKAVYESKVKVKRAREREGETRGKEENFIVMKEQQDKGRGMN